jgi:thiamine pyrophosphate-dependent acetolactate synthase large subunit-like protein
VLLEAPIDVLRTEVPDTLPELPPPPERAAPSPADVEALAKLVKSWTRPLILAGGGVVAAKACGLLSRLAATLGAPVFHTANGKGTLIHLPELDAGLPWFKGTSDLRNMEDNFSPLFAQADGLLAVGCRFSQLATGSWALKLPPSVAQIDVDPAEIGRHYPVQLGLVCDALKGLDALVQHFAIKKGGLWATIPPRPPWRVPGMDVVAPLRRALPAGSVLSCDVTRLGYVLMADFTLDGPNRFLHPAGAVAMGYALPAALGAKAAFPDRKVIAVCGDGGFQMSALELATAVQEDLGVVVLLVNDSCLTLIKTTQHVRYSDRFVGVDLRNPDFAKFAEAFGVAYAQPQSDETLEAELRKAFDSPGTTVIEIRPADARA